VHPGVGRPSLSSQLAVCISSLAVRACLAPARQLGGQFSEARFLLVVLTPALFTSKSCLAEINTAYKNKVQVIPILFEDTSEVKAQWSMITKNSDFDEKEMVRLCTYEHALSRHFAGWKRKKKKARASFKVPMLSHTSGHAPVRMVCPFGRTFSSPADLATCGLI
jgi:hypothetical protein